MEAICCKVQACWKPLADEDADMLFRSIYIYISTLSVMFRVFVALVS